MALRYVPSGKNVTLHHMETTQVLNDDTGSFMGLVKYYNL
jgi:hypothetical protein